MKKSFLATMCGSGETLGSPLTPVGVECEESKGRKKINKLPKISTVSGDVGVAAPFPGKGLSHLGCRALEAHTALCLQRESWRVGGGGGCWAPG